MLRLWNWINVGISRADSGESYLMPCLIESDLSSLRAAITVRSVNKTVRGQLDAHLEHPLTSSGHPHRRKSNTHKKRFHRERGPSSPCIAGEYRGAHIPASSLPQADLSSDFAR